MTAMTDDSGGGDDCDNGNDRQADLRRYDCDEIGDDLEDAQGRCRARQTDLREEMRGNWNRSLRRETDSGLCDGGCARGIRFVMVVGS
ncbi:unnamed protein product [Linum trigynum]|uniref:Uncharacterized protein n=1 Tax=Linum trigynum TaxID=586398 RepID=A0AAV2DCF0_9ROSI